jgi:hypothetical protein
MSEAPKERRRRAATAAYVLVNEIGARDRRSCARTVSRDTGCPHMHKLEREGRLGGPKNSDHKREESSMRRFAGINMGADSHMVAVVDENGAVLRKATAFGEDAAGYRRIWELLEDPGDVLVAMEATGI